MADGGQYIETVRAELQRIYEPAFAVALNQRYATYALLKNRGRVITNGKLQIEWLVKTARHGNATSIPDGGTLPDPGHSTRTPARLDFKIIVAVISVGRLLNLGSKSDQYFKLQGVLDALADQTQDAIDDVANKLNTQITANTKVKATDLDSLADAICSTTNIYANINRALNTFWRPYVNHNSDVNRALTETLIQDMLYNLNSIRGASVAEVWCGTQAWEAMEALVRSIAPIRNNDPNRTIAGATYVEYRKVPYILNPDIDTNRMIFHDYVNGGPYLVKQHQEEILIKAESTDSYDTRLSAAVHANLWYKDTYHQGCLDDVQ